MAVTTRHWDLQGPLIPEPKNNILAWEKQAKHALKPLGLEPTQLR